MKGTNVKGSGGVVEEVDVGTGVVEGAEEGLSRGVSAMK